MQFCSFIHRVRLSVLQRVCSYRALILAALKADMLDRHARQCNHERKPYHTSPYSILVQHSAPGRAGRPLVNFDVALGELVREAKWLGRLGCEVPEAARRVLLQEHKFKFYYSRLHFLLRARGSSSVPRLLSLSQQVHCRLVAAEFAPPSASHSRKLASWSPLTVVSEILHVVRRVSMV